MSIYDLESPEGSYLKFKHGTVARVRLFGEGRAFTKQFGTDAPKQRFATLCIFRNKETSKNEIKVLEFGWEIQKRLKALKKDSDWGDPTTYDIEITATGDGLDREYQVVPKPKKDLSATDNTLIKECDWDLVKLTSPKSADEDPPPHEDSEYDEFE